ncbi:MAG: type II toxin-antitoxin system RelB/DinJ family antitoxin [Lachnospiraceae bacterium]|nr:type II toxin-antitoxin system RelB/DinJ family antitoxin [Lachnospiraceae bacterium]
MASTIQVRVDDDLRKKSDELFRQLGTDTTSAIRMFLTQAVLNKGFPFEITMNRTEIPYIPMTEAEMLDKLEASRFHASNRQYRDADSVISDMRGKYGL